MPTTTMALSSPLNSSSLNVTSQVAALKDEPVAISPQLTQQHDTTAAETAQLSSSDDSDDIIKATNVNGNNMKNGAVASLLTAEHGSPKMSLHSPITIGTSLSSELDVDLNIKGGDMSCLNVVTSSSPTSLSSGANNNHFLNNGTNGHLLSGGGGSASLNFQASNSPDSSPWSIGEVENSGFVNYSSTNNGQMHKRPIMSQQPHHGLSPNSSIGRNNASQQQQQQYIHYNKNNGNNSNNYSAAAWSNSGPNSPWQQQQHQQMHQQQQQQQLLQHQSSSQASLNNWNRGRSVPTMNPLSPHLPPHQRKHQTPTQYSMPPSASSSQGLSPNLHSPSKYRRSTSYPGKNQNMHGYQMDAVGGIIEDQSYMSYQVNFISFYH
jgi:hypothetical protein